MNFLAPLFLIGALAVAAPVVFHLIRRTTKLRTVFGSLMFLRTTPPRLTKRNRLEHLLLLLLRCAVLCLLAAGFARPFLKQVLPDSSPPGQAKRIAVLVDASASMRRGNLWSEARDKAEEVLRRASPVDHVALFTFDRTLKPLVTFEQWDSTSVNDRVALARGRLADASPGWFGTLLDQALIRAADSLADTGETNANGPRQIVIISDMQTGSHLGGLQSYDWPKGLEVSVEPVGPRRTSNAGLQLVADAGDTQRSADAGVRVRVSNEPDAKREQFQVGWAREGGVFVGKAADIYVPPGQSRIVTLPVPATNAVTDRIVLRGDDEDFDNTVFAVPPDTARLSVLYLGSEVETDTRQPLYFIKRAFQETRRQDVRVASLPPTALLPAADAAAATLFIVTDALNDTRARALRELVSEGRTILFAPTSAEALPTLAALLGLERLVGEEVKPANNYGMLGEIDFRHPLFAAFADPRFSDFTKIHFWKYRRLDTAAIPGVRVLARFDNGDAAILDVSVGKGRVLVLASGWHPADSQLALSSKFVPLLYSILELSGGVASAPSQYFVGDPVPFPADPSRTNAATTILSPDGKPLTLAASETNFTGASMPGIYRVNSEPKAKRFAVNLDTAESRTAPLPLDELERLGAPTPRQTLDAARTAERKIQLQSAEIEGRQKLWRWFIVATLTFLLFETWLAGRTARRQTPMEGVAT